MHIQLSRRLARLALRYSNPRLRQSVVEDELASFIAMTAIEAASRSDSFRAEAEALRRCGEETVVSWIRNLIGDHLTDALFEFMIGDMWMDPFTEVAIEKGLIENRGPHSAAGVT